MNVLAKDEWGLCLFGVITGIVLFRVIMGGRRIR